MNHEPRSAENVVSVPKEAVTRLLDAWHRTLQNDFRKRDQAASVIDSCMALGLITADECRLRLLALSSCPGHNDSRVWCAYCGDVVDDDDDGDDTQDLMDRDMGASG